jgi:hypothetical protein
VIHQPERDEQGLTIAPSAEDATQFEVQQAIASALHNTVKALQNVYGASPLFDAEFCNALASLSIIQIHLGRFTTADFLRFATAQDEFMRTANGQDLLRSARAGIYDVQASAHGAH